MSVSLDEAPASGGPTQVVSGVSAVASFQAHVLVGTSGATERQPCSASGTVGKCMPCRLEGRSKTSARLKVSFDSEPCAGSLCGLSANSGAQYKHSAHMHFCLCMCLFHQSIMLEMMLMVMMDDGGVQVAFVVRNSYGYKCKSMMDAHANV